jgi:hypothetical protein
MDDPVAEFLAREDGALDDDIDVGAGFQQPEIVEPAAPAQGNTTHSVIYLLFS